MVCEAKEEVGFYRPRQPQETPFYKLACPPKPWRRWIIARAVERFLDCGDVEQAGGLRLKAAGCRL